MMKALLCLSAAFCLVCTCAAPASVAASYAPRDGGEELAAALVGAENETDLFGAGESSDAAQSSDATSAVEEEKTTLSGTALTVEAPEIAPSSLMLSSTAQSSDAAPAVGAQETAPSGSAEGQPVSAAEQTYPPFPFADVPDTSPFRIPIAWGVIRGVAQGTSPVAFSPKSDCKRKHIITFIWRAEGRPEPQGEFPYADEDLNPDSDFGKAAHWAYQVGIETGNETPQGTYFDGETKCARAQAVTYLYKLEKPPLSEVDIEGMLFGDVPSDDEYAFAVAWAVSIGITNGNGTFDENGTPLFGRDIVCNRGHIITFLYRYKAFKNAL